MKEVNYKELKKYSNLPKYDIGTVSINSGYQRNADQTQAGYFTQDAERVTNAFVPQAISSGVQNVASPLLSLGKSAANYINTYNNTIQEIGAKYGKLAAQQVGDEARNAVYNEGLNVAKSSAKSAASKALGAANIALNAYGAIHGGYGLYENSRDNSTLTAGDLSAMGARSTEYANGVAYDRMGGFDETGVNKYVSDQNKANKISGITSGLEAGAGIGGLIGSIFPGAGTLIGSGIGALVGAIGGGMFGHHAREKRKRAIEEAKRNYATAADAYNTQNESEAASTGLRNQYYATHADKGLNAGEEPNALVNNDEVIGTVKNGKVKKAFTVDSDLPDRYDGIPANLGPNDFVIGHKIGPDGVELNEKAQIYERMFNSNDPRLQKIGEDGLLQTLKTQKRTPDNNPNPWDMLMADKGKNMKRYNIGKCLPMFDGGIWKGSEMPITNYLLNFVDNSARRKQIEREPIQVNESYAPNPYVTQAGALMPTMVDISTELADVNDQARMANYAINQSAYSPGQRMAMLSQLYNNSIKNRSKIIASKTDRENAMRQQYAQWLSQVGESEATRRQQSRTAYNQSKQQAYAQKRLLLDNVAKDKRGDLNSFFQNLYNVYWGNKNINLYQQDLDRKDRELVASLNNKPATKSTLAQVPYTLNFNPTYKLSDMMFGNYSPFKIK